MIQGEIGVLDRKDMDHFADIFLAYQKRGKPRDEQGQQGFAVVTLLIFFSLSSQKKRNVIAF
jgi:hypothetical protein